MDITSWEFKVANLDNNIGDYTPELVVVENGQSFDARAADALAEFIAAAREQACRSTSPPPTATTPRRPTSTTARSRSTARRSPRP
ncbi:MAG: hypothetical protein ACLTSG_02495 [Lachnospiraceae bacterium]